MIDPKKIHELEQGIAALVEVIPTALGGMMKALVNDQGFSRTEALELIKTWMVIALTPRQEPPNAKQA